MPVNIKNKEYKTVAERVNEFRADHPNKPIETEIISSGETVLMKAVIRAEGGRIIATGYAEEVRGSSNINKTSALENCETSAIGRALANFGYSGTEYASANEVLDAIVKQKEIECFEFYQRHNEALINNIQSLEQIRSYISRGDLFSASEAWYEIPEEIQNTLWVAPKKGGFFTTKEREIIKSAEFRKSYYGENNE